MKKYSIMTVVAIAAIASVTLYVSCKKEQTTNHHQFTATMEQCESKTVLNGMTLEWTANDQILVYDGTNNPYGYYQATPLSNPTMADFTLFYSDNAETMVPPYYAIYPVSTNLYYNFVYIPQTQASVAGELNGFPMFAKSNNEVLSFKNLCGVLKLNLTKANVNVTSIAVTAATPINGYFTIDNTGDVPGISYYSNGTKTTTLTCSTAQSITSGHDFYIYLPAGSYSNLQITIGTDDNKFCTKVSNTDIVVNRNQITSITLGESNLTFEDGVQVILTTDDVWGDGTGYQMLLDPTATAYDNVITGHITCGDPYNKYSYFAYKIPADADGDCSTTHMVCNASESIIIPAGTYDFYITNPVPGDRIWLASTDGNIGGRVNDFVFEAGNTYEFHVYDGGSNDATDVTITGANAGAKGNNHKPTKANNSAMAVDCRTK